MTTTAATAADLDPTGSPKASAGWRVLSAMAGQLSSSMSLYTEAPYLRGGFAFPLKDAACAGMVSKSLAALDSAAASALLGALLGDTSSV